MKSLQQIVFSEDFHFSNYVVKFSKSSYYQMNSSQICREKWAHVKFLSFQKEVMRCKHLQNTSKSLWLQNPLSQDGQSQRQRAAWSGGHLTPLINLCIPAWIQPQQYLYLGTDSGGFFTNLHLWLEFDYLKMQIWLLTKGKSKRMMLKISGLEISA